MVDAVIFHLFIYLLGTVSCVCGIFSFLPFLARDWRANYQYIINRRLFWQLKQASKQRKKNPKITTVHESELADIQFEGMIFVLTENGSWRGIDDEDMLPRHLTWTRDWNMSSTALLVLPIEKTDAFLLSVSIWSKYGWAKSWLSIWGMSDCGHVLAYIARPK